MTNSDEIRDLEITRAGDSQLTEIVRKKDGLSNSIVPILQKLSKFGLTADQIDNIIDVPYRELGKNQGKSIKVKAFMNAIVNTQKPEYLASLATNYGAYKAFLDTANDVEEIREEMLSNGLPFTYSQCFVLVSEIGIHQARNLIDKLDSEINSTSEHVSDSEKAVRKATNIYYTAQGVIADSKNTGHDLETIMDFITKKIPSEYLNLDSSTDENPDIDEDFDID